MHIPQDLQSMYDFYFDISLNPKIEKIPISPELIMTLIERIGGLEADIANPNSYLHYECKQKLQKEIE